MEETAPMTIIRALTGLALATVLVSIPPAVIRRRLDP
jgi:hypothetical protein